MRRSLLPVFFLVKYALLYKLRFKLLWLFLRKFINQKIPAHASFGTFSKSAFSCWGSLANPQNSSYNFLKLIEISQANFLNMGQFQGILYTIEVFLCYPAAPPLSGYPSWILKQWETCPRVTLKTHPNFIFSPLFIQINLRWKKHLYW